MIIKTHPLRRRVFWSLDQEAKERVQGRDVYVVREDGVDGPLDFTEKSSHATRKSFAGVGWVFGLVFCVQPFFIEQDSALDFGAGYPVTPNRLWNPQLPGGHISMSITKLFEHVALFCLDHHGHVANNCSIVDVG